MTADDDDDALEADVPAWTPPPPPVDPARRPPGGVAGEAAHNAPKAPPERMVSWAAVRDRTDGVACPRCGCRHVAVLKTRHAGVITARRRECRNCGRVFLTHETAI